ARIAPRRDRMAKPSRWHAVGGLVARRPVRLLAVSTLFLLVLAAFWPTLTPSYDTQELVPSSMPSSKGYAVLDRRFHDRELNPDYDLVTSDHDLRTTRDLAVLDQVSLALARVSGVTEVRGVTRPDGTVIPKTQLPNQLGDVGDKLG